jgi:hypothetical protein
MLAASKAADLVQAAPAVCGPDCQAAQRAALEAFYRAMNGPNWTEKHGWLVEEDHCDWYGVVCCSEDGTSITSAYAPAAEEAPPATYNVSCPAAGAVVGLQLISNNLAGEVTPEFARAALEPLAPYMLYLYLRENNVTGPLGPLLRGMRYLQRFGVTS